MEKQELQLAIDKANYRYFLVTDRHHNKNLLEENNYRFVAPGYVYRTVKGTCIDRREYELSIKWYEDVDGYKVSIDGDYPGYDPRCDIITFNDDHIDMNFELWEHILLDQIKKGEFHPCNIKRKWDDSIMYIGSDISSVHIYEKN